MPQLYIPQPVTSGLLNTLSTVENIKQQRQQRQNFGLLQEQQQFENKLKQDAAEAEKKANRINNLTQIYKFLGPQGRKKAMMEISQISGIPLNTDKYDEFADVIERLHKAEKELNGDPKLLSQLAEQLLTPFQADEELQPAIKSAQQRITGLAQQQQQEEVKGAQITAASIADQMIKQGKDTREVRSYLVGTGLFDNEKINQIVGQKLGTPSLSQGKAKEAGLTDAQLINKAESGIKLIIKKFSPTIPANLMILQGQDFFKKLEEDPKLIDRVKKELAKPKNKKDLQRWNRFNQIIDTILKVDLSPPADTSNTGDITQALPPASQYKDSNKQIQVLDDNGNVITTIESNGKLWIDINTGKPYKSQ